MKIKNKYDTQKSNNNLDHSKTKKGSKFLIWLIILIILIILILGFVLLFMKTEINKKQDFGFIFY